MFDWREENVRVFVRQSSYAWAGPWKAKLKTHKQNGTCRLQGHGLDIEVTDAEKSKHLIKLRLFSRYRKLFFVEKGQIIEPSESGLTAWSPLITPSETQRADENATLEELSRPTRTRNELVGLMITYIALGLMIGYFLGNFLPLGAISHAAAVTTHTASQAGVP